MSSDIAYRLLVDMSSRGNLSPELDKVGAKAKGLDSQFKNIGASLGSGLSGAAGAFERVGDAAVGVIAKMGAIGAAGVAAGVAFGVGLNSEIEKTKISLAAIFTAQGVTGGMTAGLEVASSTIKEMRKDASMLPGEFKDLLSFFKLGATPGFQLGASTKQLEKMSANAMAAAAAVGVNMDQAAREYAQLLQGRSGSHNVFGSMLGFTGGESKKFNALTGDERLKAIEGALNKYQGSIETFGTSFDAISSTFKDNAKETLRRATEPIFSRVKEQLSLANKWFDAHEYQVGQFADKVGVTLEHGFDVGRRKIAEWLPAIRTFGDHAAEEFKKIWVHAQPLLEGVEKLGKGALASPHLFRGLEAGALGYGASKIGRMAAPMASPLASGLKDLLGSSGGLGAGLGEIAAGGAAAGIAAATLATMLVVAGGAIHSLTDETSAFHDSAVKSWQGIMANVGKSLESTGKTWEKVGPHVIAGVDAIGANYLGFLELVSLGFEKASFGLNRTIDGIGKSLEKMGTIEAAVAHAGPIDKFLARKELEHPTHERDEDLKTKKGAGGGGGGTSIQKVEIVVSSNQDPSRIARLTVDRLQDVSRFPTSSPRVRNWSSERP